MIASSYETGTAKVGMGVDGLLVSMQAIATLLQGAGINPDATLIPPKESDAQDRPARVPSAIRQLQRRKYRSSSSVQQQRSSSSTSLNFRAFAYFSSCSP